MLKNKKGQSTVEYIILVTGVVMVMIMFLVTGDKSPFKQKLNGTLDTVADGMVDITGAAVDSHIGATGKETQTPNAKAHSGIATPINVNMPPPQ